MLHMTMCSWCRKRIETHQSQFFLSYAIPHQAHNMIIYYWLLASLVSRHPYNTDINGNLNIAINVYCKHEHIIIQIRRIILTRARYTEMYTFVLYWFQNDALRFIYLFIFSVITYSGWKLAISIYGPLKMQYIYRVIGNRTYAVF